MLADAAAGTLAAGGKRLRPLLVLLCAGGDEGEAPVRAAAAVELVHMATLVHDDVVDRAPLRRGRATVFATRGRETATATGDFVFSRAFALLAANDDERAGDGARRRVPGAGAWASWRSATTPTGTTSTRSATCCAAG